MRCINDLTFHSHSWEIENNPADINKLFNFSDFSDRHWCSCHLSCACWPKMNTIFRAKQESESQSNRDMKAGQSHVNGDAQLWHNSTKSLDNWDYGPTTCKLNKKLRLSDGSSEKEIFPQWRVERTWRNVSHYSAISQENLFFSIFAWWRPWRAHAQERTGTGLESITPKPAAAICRARQTWRQRFQCPACCLAPCWYLLPP